MARGRLAAYAGLTLLLAAPRVARLAYPQVWIEDDSYLHGAFLLARGLVPYRDFPLPHPPLLEAMMAAVFLIAPISIRTAELFTQSAAFVGSLLVFAIGRRLKGPLVGSLAALLFATSALIFRYHVFEREVFIVVPVLASFLIIMRLSDGARPSLKAEVAGGVLLALALAIKLTAGAAFAGVLVWLWLDGRRRAAATIGISCVAVIAATTAVLAAWCGTDFIVQVIVFRVAHPMFASLAEKLDELRYTTDVSLACGVSGVALILWRGETRAWRGVLAQLACGFVGLVVLNPMYWAHTGIELLPWLSLGAGRLLAGAWDVFRLRRRQGELVCLAAAVALLVYVAPIRNANWQAGGDSVYGFGYRDRAELEAMGGFVRVHSRPDDLVAVPPIIAFVANRREAVPYAEIAGTVDELTTAVRQDGYLSAVRSVRRDESFWDSVEASRDRMAPRLDADLAAHRVAVVIDDSSDDLLPVLLVNLTSPHLEQLGYGLEWASPHYEAWISKPAARARINE